MVAKMLTCRFLVVKCNFSQLKTNLYLFSTAGVKEKEDETKRH